MFYSFRVRCALAIGVSVAGLSITAAKADVIYTVTTTGTIANGTSQGIFGLSGTSLNGKTFTAVQTYDATTGTYGGDAGRNYLDPATSSALITVGAITYNLGSSTGPANALIISSINGGYANDDIRTETLISSSLYFSLEVRSDPTSFLLNDNLAQTLYYTLPANGVDGAASFHGADNTQFVANISSITLTNNVPEPASLTLFGTRLAGLGWLRRRKAAR
jgi:hypothetical protein